MLEYGPVLRVHDADAKKYADEDYGHLSRLTDHYRCQYLTAHKSYEELFAEIDKELLKESDVIQALLADTTAKTSKMRLAYILRLKLLEYTRRFQGNLCRFGFAGSQTHIAVCDSIYYQFNRVIEARDIAIRHDLHVHNLHLEYH